jgi:bacterial/archaeal transporter family-2 protein
VLGGVAGAVYVTVALIAVREVGAGGVTAATIAGQLALAVLVDRLGVFGLEERAITWDQVVGIALLATGVLLVVRE